MSNTISTLDLEHYCLFTTIEDEKQDKRSHSKRREHMKSIIFKLKDFKNFITIGPSWKTTQDGNDNISLWFCHPGDPILMQMQKPGVKLELVEVTDSNINDDILGGKFIKTAISGSKEEAGLKDNKESCESPLKSKTALKRENLPHSVAGTRNSPLKVSYLTLIMEAQLLRPIEITRQENYSWKNKAKVRITNKISGSGRLVQFI